MLSIYFLFEWKNVWMKEGMYEEMNECSMEWINVWTNVNSMVWMTICVSSAQNYTNLSLCICTTFMLITQLSFIQTTINCHSWEQLLTTVSEQTIVNCCWGILASLRCMCTITRCLKSNFPLIGIAMANKNGEAFHGFTYSPTY